MADTKIPTAKIDGKHGRYADLASDRSKGKFGELGTTGLSIFGGWVRQASLSELQWPDVYSTFNRIRRTDPEMAIIRYIFGAIGRRIKLYWEGPDEKTPDDERALQFAEEVFEDLDGGIGDFRDAMLAYTPFMGWAWWEIVPALRRQGWRPPGDDDWRSEYDDGLIGIRRLGFRDHSSFHRWAIDDRTGRLQGLVQMDPPNTIVTIPLDRSVHLRFGDVNNPEGLSPLEAVYRLERYKYALELVQGIGFEHAAGYLDVKVDKKLDDTDESRIKKNARNILTAQEGNYAVWPEGVVGEVKDIDFGAASSLLEAIEFYSTQKLQQFIGQWVALSATTGTGSFAAKAEDTSMFMVAFNAMVEGLVEQVDSQLGGWLFSMNADAFPNMTERPHLRVQPVDKEIDLAELGSFVQSIVGAGIELDIDDINAIRRKTGFLPELDASEGDEETVDSTSTVDSDEGEAEDQIDDVEDGDADLSESDVQGALARFSQWASDNAPDVFKLLQRRVSR